MEFVWRFVQSIALCSIVIGYGYKKKSLSSSGAVAGILGKFV
jgi:hypothetical protein